MQSSAAPRARFSTAGGGTTARAGGSGVTAEMTDQSAVLWLLLDIVFPCCVMSALQTFISGLQGLTQAGSSATAAARAAAARSVHNSLPCSFWFRGVWFFSL